MNELNMNYDSKLTQSFDNNERKSSKSSLGEYKEYNFNGISVIKLLHVIIQFCFIAYALTRLESDIQILIPLPTGFWIIISALPNIIVYMVHIFENAPSLTITSKDNETINIKYRRFLRNKEFTVKIPEDLIETQKIHVTTAWAIVFFLGFGWNLYLMFQGTVFLRIQDYYQGISIFTYSLVTFIFYILMYFIPEREFIFYDENKGYGKFLLLPPITVTVFPKKNIQGRKNTGKILKGILQIRDPWLKSLRSALIKDQGDEINRSPESAVKTVNKGIFLLQTLIWFVFWFISSNFTFSLYHYQFIQPLAFILMAYNLRLMIYKDKSNNAADKPLWLYIFWIIIFYESGIKFWYVTALVYLNPALFGWSVVASWILYGIILGITIKELYDILKTSVHSGKIWRVSLIVLFIIALILEFTAFLSTLGIIPFYFSVLEIGPFA